MKYISLALGLTGALLVGCITTASAANVTFGNPTTESADSNVSTVGMLSYAYNFTDGSLASPTINGVLFTNLTNFANGNVVTNYANNYNGFGSSSAPFSSLSAAYQNLLSTGYYQGNNATITLQNLTVGHSYLFEYFVDDSRGGGMNAQNLYGGAVGANMVVLNLSSSTAAGALGQYVIGNFTADATTQLFTVTGTPVTMGFELRDTTAGTAAPEPGTYALLGLGGLVLTVLRRRRRA